MFTYQHRIGFGAAQAFLDAGAKVVVISSQQANVDSAIKRLASPDVTGAVGNVRDEDEFVQVLRDHAPVDHIVFSGVDKIIRGNLEDLNLDDARHLFGVKFWGSLTVGKGNSLLFSRDQISNKSNPVKSRQEIRHYQTRWFTHSHLRHSRSQARKGCISRWRFERRSALPHERTGW
jgi:NAD(P)-dependent dehydrogenase (short-subunit alcohol dehydrogenase family)